MNELKTKKTSKDINSLKPKITEYFKYARDFKDWRAKRNKYLMSCLNKIACESGFNVDDMLNLSVKAITSYSNKTVHPVFALNFSEKISSGWVPYFSFAPEQRNGKGGDTYAAKNYSNVYDFVLRNGGFKKECMKGGLDMFVYGRMFLWQGWSVANDDNGLRADTLQFKNIKWEDVYWTEDENHWFIQSMKTKTELMDMFGIKIKELADVKYGTASSYDNKVDWDENKSEKKIELLVYYCPIKKVYVIMLGGEIFRSYTENRYPFIGKNGKPFCPITYIDNHALKVEGHPISDADLIVDIWINMSEMYTASMVRERRASRSRQIIGVAGDPNEARKSWMVGEAARLRGVDLPEFINTNGGSITSATLDTGNNLNNLQTMRSIFMEDIMMATGVNIMMLGRGADTAEQEKLKIRREMETIDKNITINIPNWVSIASKTAYMLKGVDAKLLYEHVEIVDAYSEKYDVQGEKKTIKEFLDGLEDFDFDIKPEINHHNQKRKATETSNKITAFQTLLNIPPNAPKGVRMMGLELAQSQYPNLDFTNEKDFEYAPPPELQAQPAAAQAPIV